MRAVVVGGSGQIGGWLLHHLADRGHEAIGTYASQPFAGLVALDAADAGAPAWVAAQQPEVVFYPAGFTWVDGCERDPERCDAANLHQPCAIAREVARQGARFVYFSTDYVFDGEQGPYGEDDIPAPLSVYGRSKLQAEQTLLRELGNQALIVRTCWVYGPERQGKNFSYQVVKTLSASKPVVCPSDQAANPSYGPDVALASLRAVEEGMSGLLHIAGPEWVHREVFARAIAAAFGLDAAGISSKPTHELGLGAPRPLNGGLRSERLNKAMPGCMRPLAAALDDFHSALSQNRSLANPLQTG